MTAEMADQKTSAIDLTTASIDCKISVHDFTDKPINISPKDHFNLQNLTLWSNRKDGTYKFTLASGESLTIYGTATSYGENGNLTIVAPKALSGDAYHLKMVVDYSR